MRVDPGTVRNSPKLGDGRALMVRSRPWSRRLLHLLRWVRYMRAWVRRRVFGCFLLLFRYDTPDTLVLLLGGCLPFPVIDSGSYLGRTTYRLS